MSHCAAFGTHGQSAVLAHSKKSVFFKNGHLTGPEPHSELRVFRPLFNQEGRAVSGIDPVTASGQVPAP